MCVAGLRTAFPGRNGGFRGLAGSRWAFPGPNGGILCDAGLRTAFPGQDGGFCALAGPRWAFPGRNGGFHGLAGSRWAFPGPNGGILCDAGLRTAFPGPNGGVRVLGLDLYILFLNFVVMKKISLLCLALALAFSAAYAQQGQGLSFAGIPIAGTVGEFSDALAGAGFELCGENDSGVLLKGPFCGINCTVLVKYRPEDKSVRGVDAMCPIRSDWKLCKSEYLALQKELTAAYGRPKKIEKFDHPFREGDGCELRHLNMGLCKWLSDYVCPGGSVTLRIQPVIVNNGQVTVSFEL